MRNRAARPTASLVVEVRVEAQWAVVLTEEAMEEAEVTVNAPEEVAVAEPM